MATSTNITVPPDLARHPFLEGLPEPLVKRLATLAFEVRFEEDQIIFRENDPSSFFYLILTGRVGLELLGPGRVFRVQTIGEGEELGWSSLLSSTSKQFQARSLEPVTAYAFDGARLRAACEEDHEFGYFVMRNILAIVADRLKNTRLQALDVFYAKGGSNS